MPYPLKEMLNITPCSVYYVTIYLLYNNLTAQKKLFHYVLVVLLHYE